MEIWGKLQEAFVRRLCVAMLLAAASFRLFAQQKYGETASPIHLQAPRHT